MHSFIIIVCMYLCEVHKCLKLQKFFKIENCNSYEIWFGMHHPLIDNIGVQLFIRLKMRYECLGCDLMQLL